MPEAAEVIETVEAIGESAGRQNLGLGANPYSQAQGSGTRVFAIAWRRGYLRGRKEQEILEQEQSEDIFFR